MDRCPPEIWAEISAFACTDDGRTGRSLSLVSRALSEISKPYKLQSITVLGPHQLIAFAALLERLPAPLPRVTRIYISNHNHSTRPSVGASSQLPSSRNVASWNKREAFSAAERILCALGPSVKVVHAFLTAFPWNHRIADLLPVSMPLLEELVVHGLRKRSPEASHARDIVSFPALRRLELTPICSPLYAFGIALQQAPNVVHLTVRADGVDRDWAALAREAKERSKIGGSALPTGLEKIYIYRPTQTSEYNPLDIQNVVRALEDLAEVDRRILLLPPSQEHLMVSVETSLRMWNDDDGALVITKN